MQIIKVRKDDVILLSHPGVLSKNAIEHMQDCLMQRIKQGGGVVVLEEGMTVSGIVRKDTSIWLSFIMWARRLFGSESQADKSKEVSK